MAEQAEVELCYIMTGLNLGPKAFTNSFTNWISFVFNHISFPDFAVTHRELFGEGGGERPLVVFEHLLCTQKSYIQSLASLGELFFQILYSVFSSNKDIQTNSFLF